MPGCSSALPFSYRASKCPHVLKYSRAQKLATVNRSRFDAEKFTRTELIALYFYVLHKSRNDLQIKYWKTFFRTNQVSRLAHSVAVDNDFNEDRVIFEEIPRFDVIVADKLCAAKAGVLFHPWSPQERLVLRTRIWFDAELDVLASIGVVILIKKKECDSVIKWPFQ